MNIFPADPVNLSLKGKLLSVLSCFSVILVMAWVTQLFTLDSAYPILVASMGASTVIVFIIPNSPLAQPWPLIGGQLVSTIVGVACTQIISDPAFTAACAVGGSIFAMLLLRCLHPPGAASALAPVMSGDTLSSLGYGFVLLPVSLNVTVMLVLALVINRLILQHEYPTRSRHSSPTDSNANIINLKTAHSGVSEADIEQALQNSDTFMDITAADLNKVLADAKKYSVIRSVGTISCADIMVSPVLAVEYGTEVEDAWKLMHGEKLKALPVIDRSRRVIGIITWHDFFKFIQVNSDESFKEKFRAFIRRTPELSTKKPESVGHIMTAPVTVLPRSAHVVDLVELMSKRGHRQIPIVNDENRLVGMVYQANLIAALYNENFDSAKN